MPWLRLPMALAGGGCCGAQWYAPLGSSYCQHWNPSICFPLPALESLHLFPNISLPGGDPSPSSPPVLPDFEPRPSVTEILSKRAVRAFFFVVAKRARQPVFCLKSRNRAPFFLHTLNAPYNNTSSCHFFPKATLPIVVIADS